MYEKDSIQRTNIYHLNKSVFVNKMASGIEGQKAPDFHLHSLGGKIVSLNDYKGTPTLFVTWATWCGVCREELPALNQTKRTGYKVVLVNLTSEEGSVGQVSNFVKSLHLTCPVLLDKKGIFEKAYQIKVIPTSVLVDENGVILHVFYGPINEHSIENWLPTMG